MTHPRQSGTPRPTPDLWLWVACGVLLFAVLASLTVVVVLRTPGPGAVSRTAARPQATHSSANPTPSPTPPKSAADSTLHTMRMLGASCPNFTLRRSDVAPEELEPYLNSLIDCLELIHREPFTQARVALSRPALKADSEVHNSGCDTALANPQDWVGLYCGPDATIYYRRDWSPASPLTYVDVLTHEFAHHLQWETDILHRVHEQQQVLESQSGGAARSQELTRRLELQAECLTGVVLGPQGPFRLKPAEFENVLEGRTSVPPEWAASHGSGRAQTRWFKAGAESRGDFSRCNTFTAAPEIVE